MARQIRRSSSASDPGRIPLSHEKLKLLRPELYGIRGLYERLGAWLGRWYCQLKHIEDHLLRGDSRAAVVVSIDPLLVAAYTDELDCVAVLRFPDDFVEQYKLREGKRLLTVNTYQDFPQYDRDLEPGPRSTHRWTGFHPIIAEFVSDAITRISERKQEISNEEWQRAYRMGKAYIADHPDFARDGRPMWAMNPAVRFTS